MIEPLESRVLMAATPPSSTAAPDVAFHLTARPWTPTNVSAETYLTEVEQVARGIVKYQDSSGRIIDPYQHAEVQYSTAYFAFAIGTLVSAGRAMDLLGAGVAAMNSATTQINDLTTPDQKESFALPPLAGAIALYEPHVPSSTVTTWRSRIDGAIGPMVVDNLDHNHRTYAMKGQWLRYVAGIVGKSEATSFVEQAWNDTQEWRLSGNSLNLYQDESSTPDTFAVDAAARANLTALLEAGYDGPSVGDMARLLKSAAKNSLSMQGAGGDSPTGGRTSDHVWNDAVNGLDFEMMAGRAQSDGNAELAAQYSRAASLSVLSAQRWQRSDGSYFVTKNTFDPSLRVGYQDSSDFTNYNGYLLYHWAEAYAVRAGMGDSVTEAPAPVEIGGYAFQTSSDFSAVFADAGGMQLQGALSGATELSKGQYWTTLGIDRFGRVGWDPRLGPGDGVRDASSGQGVSFAPTFKSGGTWNRLGSMPDKYQGTFSVSFVHPLLVRAAIDYRPTGGYSGPSFHDDLIITPDGVLSTMTSSAGNGDFGTTLPILTRDGASTLSTTYTPNIASTKFADGNGDEQAYLVLNSDPTLTATDATVRGGYGDIRPVRAVSSGSANRVFVYPRSAGDPTAEEVRTSFAQTGGDFSSTLGRVTGNTYVGRTSAGGVASGIDLDGDGTLDLTFDKVCSFIAQVAPDRAITRIEADRAVTATLGGWTANLQAYKPEIVDLVTPTPTPTPAPVLLSTTAGDGFQQSQVRSISLTFDRPVALSAGAASLQMLNSGGSGADDGLAPKDASSALARPTTSDGGRIWVYTFVPTSDFVQRTSSGASTGSLVDGVYTISVDPTKVTAGGVAMMAGVSMTFHRLFGDVNGSKGVNTFDFGQFRSAFGKRSTDPTFNPAFDFDGNRSINVLDYSQLRIRFGRSFTY